MSYNDLHSIQSAAAAAQISGERQTICTYSVLTGDKPSDFMLAMLAAMQATGVTVTEAAEVAEYLAHRWRRTVADLDLHRHSMDKVQQHFAHLSAMGQAQPASPGDIAAQIGSYIQQKYQTSGNPPAPSGSGMSPSTGKLFADKDVF